MERKYTGVRFTPSNSNGANWGQQIFSHYRQHLLDTLKNYGESDDFGYWLNDMQSRHANLYKNARNSGDWQKTAYANDDVRKYQEDYQGIGRYGQFNPDSSYKTDFNNLAIVKAQENDRYNVSGPKRISGDYGNKGFKADGLYSAITDDRRLLGREGDWDEDSDEFKQWQKDLNSVGWETYLDKDGYYKLKRFQSTPQAITQPTATQPVQQKQSTSVPAVHTEHKKFNLGNLSKYVPGLLEIGRLIGNQVNNEKIYDEAIKGIKPDILDTYHTHRQVVGDEAGKQAYYRRAAEGEMRAAKPITSDMDKQIAYRMEAKKNADDLRAQGDLVDNQEIRRTSDEANQHQWANAQRDVEVNNANRASRNKAEAMKHNLLAQKHAAQWTSFDNFLQGVGTNINRKLAEERNLDDQIFALQSQKELAEHPRVLAARKEIDDLLKKHNNDYNHPEVLKASQKYQTLKYDLAIEQAQKRKDYYNSRGTIFGKSGTKITRKEKKDELLYKSTKDAIEHFRKMSKLSSDGLNRRPITIQKLASHPKGNTRRYQQGGVAPFTVYRPIMAGGETTTTTQNDTSNTNGKSKGNDTLDLVKELFKSLQGTGLPSDTNIVYESMQNLLKRSQLFGNELTTDDISSMYLQQMQQINKIKFNKAQYDNAVELVNKNDARNEYAIDQFGNLVVQNKDSHQIERKSWDEVKNNLDKYNPLTNDNLLNLRAYSSPFNDDLIHIASNGIGISKIADFLKSQLPHLGSSESTIEGYTKSDSNKIKAGLELLKDAPAGDYKFTQYSKDQQQQAKMAINYLIRILPKNMRTTLDIHSELQGISKEQLIQSMVASTISENSKIEFDPVKNSNKEETIKSNFLDQVQRDQIGIDREFSLITKDGNTKLYSLNSKYISQLPNVSEDMSLEKMLGVSKIGSIMDSRLGVTFGDQIIDPQNFKDIMFDLGGGATIVTLPCKYENGHKVVNFAIKDEFDDAVKEVSQKISVDYNNPNFVKALSEKLHEKGLDSLLNGNSIDPNMFGHFMVVSAYTTDKINFNTNSKYIEKVKNPDSNLEDRIIKGLSTNKDKNDYELDIDDKFGFLELTYDDIYRGNVFIPLNNDPVSAQTGWGDSVDLKEARSLAEDYQNFQKSSKQKESSSSVLQ